LFLMFIGKIIFRNKNSTNLGFKATAGLKGFRNIWQTTQDFRGKKVLQVHARVALSPVR